MYILRCTRKLLERVEPTGPAAGLSTTALGDRFAQPLGIGRRRFVLLTSDRTRLPVVMPARDTRRLGRTFSAALAEMLVNLDVDPVLARAALSRSPNDVYS